jgi:hypothetical protein
MFNQSVRTIPPTVPQIPMAFSDGPWANAWHPVWEDSMITREASAKQVQKADDCHQAAKRVNEPSDQS